MLFEENHCCCILSWFGVVQEPGAKTSMKHVDTHPLLASHYQFFNAFFLNHSCTDMNKQGPHKQLVLPDCRAELGKKVMLNLCCRAVLETPNCNGTAEGKTVINGEY